MISHLLSLSTIIQKDHHLDRPETTTQVRAFAKLALRYLEERQTHEVASILRNKELVSIFLEILNEHTCVPKASHVL